MEITHISEYLSSCDFIAGVHSLVRNSIRFGNLADDQLQKLFEKLSPEEQVQLIKALEPLRKEELFEEAAFKSREFTELRARQRPPSNTEAKLIRPEDILILSKKSRVEIDCEKFHLSAEGVKDLYLKNKEEDIDKKFAAHRDHVKARSDLQNELPEATWVDIWELNQERRELLLQDQSHKLILVLGGDDTLKLVGPYIQDQYVVLCNSNADHSNGAMAQFNNTNIHEFLQEILSSNFVVEEWTRVEAQMTLPNGDIVSTKPAINEIGIRDRSTELTARAEISSMGKLKGTGALVTTGAGVTGWFSSAAKYRYPTGHVFSRTAKRAELCVREPYGDKIDLNQNFTAIEDDQVLSIVSTSNNNLELCIDGQLDLVYPMPRGSKAEIKISDRSLKVINLRRGDEGHADT